MGFYPKSVGLRDNSCMTFMYVKSKINHNLPSAPRLFTSHDLIWLHWSLFSINYHKKSNALTAYFMHQNLEVCSQSVWGHWILQWQNPNQRVIWVIRRSNATQTDQPQQMSIVPYAATAEFSNWPTRMNFNYYQGTCLMFYLFSWDHWKSTAFSNIVVDQIWFRDNRLQDKMSKDKQFKNKK